MGGTESPVLLHFLKAEEKQKTILLSVNLSCTFFLFLFSWKLKEAFSFTFF